MIVINFKTFEESSGKNGVELVKKIESACLDRTIPVIVAVQAIDLREIVEVTSLPVWVQNIDPITFGAHTGQTLAEEALSAGARGTLLNHSENKYADMDKLEFAIKHAQNIGMEVLVFASNLEELAKVVAFAPNYASYEPPELIGSQTTSVAQAQPDVIGKAFEICQKVNVPLIVGAGIHSTDDVRVSVSLGALGVAVATDIVKSADPVRSLTDLMKGFNK
jgi:triosephosphate isomerase